MTMTGTTSTIHTALSTGLIPNAIKKSVKTIETKPQVRRVKSKCKRCKCEDIQTVVVVDRYTRVVQGFLVPIAPAQCQ